MGEVVRTFMPIRMAQRYVEIIKSEATFDGGKSKADVWWQKFEYHPTVEEMKLMNKEVTRLLYK